ncbi:MAG: metallophosphoesterase family protein [Brevinematales bacterium]|nr:metallophosphoesterase family protein [Brevinematales bacterium]
MKFGFASDLHINNEKWTIEVLKELVEKSPPILILGGDVFDSFDDLLKQKDNFISLIEDSNLEKVFFLPGNHDILGSSLEEIEKINFGRKIKLKTTIPYSIENVEDKEFIFVPYQKDLSMLYNSEIPLKTKERIFIGHGSIIDYNYSNEDENSFFDNGFFKLIETDLIFLGHIHCYAFFEDRNLFYPGSARVWRKGEEGDHGFLISDTDKKQVSFVKLENGGKFIRVLVRLEENEYYLSQEIDNIDKNTFVEFVLDGIVNDLSVVEALKNELKEKYLAKNISFDEVNIVNIGNYYNSAIFKTFMKKWREHLENAVTEEERENYLLARKLFIKELEEVKIDQKN